MASHAQLVGHRFDHLLVLELVEVTKAHGARWLCVCDCGNRVVKATRELKRGAWVQRCTACLKTRTASATHGFSGEPLYKIWTSMRERCLTPSHPFFHCYGGKGVSIDPAWNDYTAFRSWALANGYEHHPERSRGDRLSIDRINSNGNYEPGNCRWIPGRDNARRAAISNHTKEKDHLRIIA